MAAPAWRSLLLPRATSRHWLIARKRTLADWPQKPGNNVSHWPKRAGTRQCARDPPTAFDLQKVTWPIELVLEERIVDAKGNVRQPEWKCDGAMVDRIDRADEGDHIAICTIDGNLMRDATGRLVPGIAAALLRAAQKRRVRIWLFIFVGLGTPGPRPSASHRTGKLV